MATAHAEASRGRSASGRSTSGLAAGAVAGLIGGIVVALFAMVRAALLGLGFWLPMKEIAAIWYGVGALIGGAGIVIVGIATHLALATFVGLLVGTAVRGRTPMGLALVYGEVAAIGLWAVMTFLVLPWADPVMSERVHLLGNWWLFYHFIYGFPLLLAPPLARAMA